MNAEVKLPPQASFRLGLTRAGTWARRNSPLYPQPLPQTGEALRCCSLHRLDKLPPAASPRSFLPSRLRDGIAFLSCRPVMGVD